MKRALLLLLFNIIVLLAALSSKYWTFKEEDYISEKVLEKATPFNVTIDIEYLRKLDPAYEQ